MTKVREALLLFFLLAISAPFYPAATLCLFPQLVAADTTASAPDPSAANHPDTQTSSDSNDFSDTAVNVMRDLSTSQSATYLLLAAAALLGGICFYLWKKDALTETSDVAKQYQILQVLEDGVILTDEKGMVEYINPAARKILSCPEKSAPCGNIAELARIFSDDGSTPLESPLLRALASAQEVCSDQAQHQLLVTPQGFEHRIRYHAKPLKNNRGQIIGGLLVFHDLTEHLALKEQFKHAQKLESVGRLAGGVAHDFNNMIGAISGTAEVMMLQMGENDPLMRYLRRIFATAIKAAELTNRLLTFTRKSAAHGNTAFCLTQTVREALEIIERSIDPKVEICPLLDNCPCPMSGDPSAIENMVINLCLNANDAMPEGGKLTVTVSRRELDPLECRDHAPELVAGEYAILSVRDTGIGIPQQRLKHIFEPFYTTKDVGKGSGLGLAAVSNTISEHHGAIKVYSEQGEGSEFTVYLPLTCKMNQTPISPASPEQAVLHRGCGTILLADDEEFMRDAGRMMLESLGYDVILAENGERAVDFYQKRGSEIDLVILDMVMPRMNGRDAFKKIIAINPEAKIIIASGFSREARVNNLFEDGLKAFIKKPYRQAEISGLLQEIIVNNRAFNI